MKDRDKEREKISCWVAIGLGALPQYIKSQFPFSFSSRHAEVKSEGRLEVRTYSQGHLHRRG
jgi:hypothetical protein